MNFRKAFPFIFLFGKSANAQVSANSETEYNLRVINQLKNAGDKQHIKRIVEHFIFFKTEHDRSRFIEYARANHYTIGKSNTHAAEAEKYPYSIQISKVSDVELETMNKITATLKEAARKYNGDYDGWGAPVEK